MYRQDADLAFLEKVPSEHLDPLVQLMIKDPKDGKSRWAEMLTLSYEYKKHNPDHHQYWELIAEELQLFGGNSFASTARGGEGVLYREILLDVCKRQKVNYNKNSSVPYLEKCLMEKMLEDGILKMPEGDLKAFCEDLDIEPTSYKRDAVLLAMRTTFKRAGFAPYPIALKVANTVARNLFGRGLPFAWNTMLTRSLGKVIPGLNVILTAWLVKDVVDLVAGPAYRITVPATLLVAYLRVALEAGELGEAPSQIPGKSPKKEKKKKKKKGKKKKNFTKWNTLTETPDGALQGNTLLLNTDGNVLTGKLIGNHGEIEIKDGTVNGNSLAWKADITTPMAMTLEFSATVKGDEISGNVKLGAFGDAKLTGTRA